MVCQAQPDLLDCDVSRVRTMKSYLDNNIVSAIVKDDQTGESQALTDLLELFDAGEVELVTSAVSLTEIKRYSGPKRVSVERTYHLLKKVPFVDDHTLLGFHNQWDHTGGASNPLVEDDPIYSSLRAIGLDRTDAHHLMLAIRANCDVFVTCDQRTILNRRQAVEAQHSLKLMKPSELVSQITGAP